MSMASQQRLILLLGLGLWAIPTLAKDYWEGNQLNNQARLGQPFNGFEEADPERKLDSAGPSYDAQVQAREARRAQSDANGMVVDLSAGGVDRFLSITRLEDGGKRFTVRLNVLFTENTAFLRPGSVDLLDRLSVLLKSSENVHIQLVFKDDADPAPGVQELHIQRASTVQAYLAMVHDSDSGS